MHVCMYPFSFTDMSIAFNIPTLNIRDYCISPTTAVILRVAALCLWMQPIPTAGWSPKLDCCHSSHQEKKTLTTLRRLPRASAMHSPSRSHVTPRHLSVCNQRTTDCWRVKVRLLRTTTHGSCRNFASVSVIQIMFFVATRCMR
jgi:hypothetical protein